MLSRLCSRSFSRISRSFSSATGELGGTSTTVKKSYWLPDHPVPRSVTSPFSHFIPEPRVCSILGAPLADGQPLVGVDLGPTFIRNAGLVKRLETDDWKVEDFGNLKFPHFTSKADDPRVNQSQVVGHANGMVFEAARPHAKLNKFHLTLGGDHSIGIGSISAILAERPDVGLIWVDAHADINTPACSGSGNIHGMVVAFLMNLHKSRDIKGFEWMKDVPLLDPRDIVYIGLRDVDPPERNILKQLGIKAFSMQEVDRYGIAKVMEMAQDHILGRKLRPLHLSFDIDSIDPAFAPSTGTRVMGGLSYREAYYICEASAETKCLSSMDLVEVNPSLSGPEGTEMTLRMAVGLISSAMGNRII